MQQESSPRKSRRKIKTLFYFISIVLFAAGVIIADWYYTIRKVEIVSDKTKIEVSTSSFIGKNTLLTSDKYIREVIMSSNPQVDTVVIQKIFPDTIKVRIYTSIPIASLEVDQGFFNLNKNGKILSKSSQKQKLPQIKYYQKLAYSSYQLGNEVSYSDIKYALHFLNKANELKLEVASVDINGLDMIRLNLKDAVILFTTEKSEMTQDYQLETIIKQFKIEGKSFQQLDLRFDKPIVRIK